ncbi:MAG: M14 family zinc carboxypeptidase [bacterium]|nr:M14 family zinc carboxypeptidase [bacterium]
MNCRAIAAFAFRCLIMLAVLVAGLAAQTPVVTYSGEAMRLRSATVTPTGGNTFALTLTMEDDNADSGLPTSFRRWWHCEVGNLPAAGAVLTVTVTNAGYSDTILPVWAQSTDGGVNFSDYVRMPTSAVPTRPSSTSHRFTIATPAGVDAIRIAKYFPYTVTRKNAYLASLASHPYVRSITPIGASQLGRPIELIELTDSSVSDAGKQRVWIHTAVHPAETPAFFLMEGFIDWLASGDPLAEQLLDHAIIDVVPMANPDGVWLGNYRTNANSVNLENEWRAPYNSTQPEILAMRTAIEGFMGTPSAPGGNPITVLLNLHATHNIAYPFHFRHVSNPNWNPTNNNAGVIPVVHQLENDWINAFEARSPFVALGSTANSTLGAPARPFVESMMHDRWTVDPQWTGAPGFQDEIMAITWEGTYGFGPTAGVWNTEADYELCGEQMGLALADYFGLGDLADISSYGATCTQLLHNGALAPVTGGHLVSLNFAGAHPASIGFIALGLQSATTPLPAPWQNCLSRTNLVTSVFVPVNAFGIGYWSYQLPAASGLAIYSQAITFRATGAGIVVDTSNGMRAANNY